MTDALVTDVLQRLYDSEINATSSGSGMAT